MTSALRVMSALIRLDSRDQLEAAERIASKHGVTVEELLQGEQGAQSGPGPARKARAELFAYLRDEGMSVNSIHRLVGVDRWTVIRDLRVWDGA